MTIKKVNKEEFEKVLESDKLLIVDFFATWCGPCQMMLPVIEELADDYKNNEKIEILKVDIDENPEIAAKYTVMSVPTFLFIKEGKVLESLIGARSKDTFIEKIEELIDKQQH